MSSTMDVQSQQLSSIVEKLISNGTNHLQVHEKYILPPHERPQMSQGSYSESIPVVDLRDLDGPNRTTVVHEIQRACEEDGFFQVQYTSIPSRQLLFSLFSLKLLSDFLVLTILVKTFIRFSCPHYFG